MTSRSIWKTWRWREEPKGPMHWSNPEDTVAIVDGLSHGSADGTTLVAASSVRRAVDDRGLVALFVEVPDLLVCWAPDSNTRCIPALRIERQADLDVGALTVLREVPAPHRALVISPREAVDLRAALYRTWTDGPVKTRDALPAPVSFHAAHLSERPDLVVIRGSTGPDAWPIHPAWVRSIKAECAEAGVAFAFTGWGRYCPTESLASLPEDVWLGERGVPTAVAHGQHFYDVGASGRLLDGHEHLALPEGL